MDINMFNIRKPPLPAKKIPFQCGNIIRETIDAIAKIAIMIHKTVRAFLFLSILIIFIL